MGAGCIKSLEQKFRTKTEAGFINIPQLNYRIKMGAVSIERLVLSLLPYLRVLG